MGKQNCLSASTDCYQRQRFRRSAFTKSVRNPIYHMTRTDPRNFLGKPYEKKCRMRAVRLALAGPEKAVRPY